MGLGAISPAGFPAPTGRKAASMPPDHGLGLDHRDRIQNRGEESVQPDEDQPTDIPEPHPREGVAPQHDHPLTQYNFSASRLGRDFSRDRATSRSLVSNSTIGVPVSQPDRPVTPNEVFNSDHLTKLGFGSPAFRKQPGHASRGLVRIVAVSRRLFRASIRSSGSRRRIAHSPDKLKPWRFYFRVSTFSDSAHFRCANNWWYFNFWWLSNVRLLLTQMP